MENRKVMKLGRSTLVVSLPKRWVELNQLKRGDILSLDIQGDGTLFVHPKATKKNEIREFTLKITPDDKKGSIIRKITSCYINGYSSIRIVSARSFTIDQQAAIRNISGKIFLRIMKADSKEIVLGSLLDASKIPLDIGIRRMHIIAVSMCKDALKAIEQHDAKLASLVYSLDDDVDQFAALLLRLLSNAAFDLTMADQIGLTLIECLDLQTLIHRIEYVADNAANIAKSVIALRRKEKFPSFLLEPLLEAGDQARGMFEEAIKAFFADDLPSANKIFELQDTLLKTIRIVIEKTLEERRASIVCATCSIRDSIVRIAECGLNIAEVVYNRSMRRK